VALRLARTVAPQKQMSAEPSVLLAVREPVDTLRSGPAADIIRAAIQKNMDSSSTSGKAILRAGLAGAAALDSLHLGIDGSQKLALIQSLVKDAVETLDTPDEAKVALKAAVDTALPAAIDGLLYSLKLAPREIPAAAAGCLPFLCSSAATYILKGPAASSK
jgi:hypothetical protein